MEDKPSAEDRRAHLGFIEDAIARMASEATTLKAWLVPVVTAAYGYAIISRSWVIAVVGVIATLIVGWQAAHYLRQEHACRTLYVSAVVGRATAFDMNIKPLLKRPTPGDKGVKEGGEEPATVSWGLVVRSWSIGGFFGPIAVGGVAIIVGVLIT